MKRYFLFLIALCAFTHLQAQSPRRVLIEVFTNASCSPCAPYDEDLHGVLDTLAVPWTMVQYHVDWPSIDPMNAHNPTDPSVRRFYYNVSGVPRGHLDGTVDPGYITGPDMYAAQSVPADFDIHLTHWLSANGDSIYVRAAYVATTTVSGNLRSFVSIQEEKKIFANPPGYNGETEFWNIHKKMLPDAYGYTMPGTIVAGDSVVWTGAWKLENIYNYDQLAVTAWVQDYTTKEVFQSAYSEPQALPFTMALDAVNDKQVNVTGASSVSSFTADMSTTLSTSGTYEFRIDKSGLPAGWSASLSVGGNSDPDLVEATVSGNGSESVQVDITSGTAIDETAEVKLIVNNKNQLSGYIKELVFTVHASPTNLIIHSADFGDAWYFPWFLDSAGAPHVTILERDMDNIDISEFTDQNINHIFFNTMDRSSSTLITDDQVAKLTAYLESGGDMLIQGEDIGYSQSLSGASQAFQDFYRDYLGAIYVSNWSIPDSFIYSMSGDSVFGPVGYVDTLNFDWYPFPWNSADQVRDTGMYAHACFEYGDVNYATAGIRNENPAKDWKVVYLAWSGKYTWNHNGKDEVFAKAIEWFDMPPLVSRADPSEGKVTVYPVPADARIYLRFADLPANSAFSLHDLYGRTVWEGPLRSGTGTLELGTAELSAGVYVLRVTQGDQLLEVKKITIRH